MSRMALALGLGLAIGGALATAAQVLPSPAPATGRVTVDGAVSISGGTVNVGNTPTVNAQQTGAWRVAVTDTPPLRLATPGILRVDRRYRIVWRQDQWCDCRVLELAGDGWIRVDARGGAGVRSAKVWVNAALAVEIEEM